MGLEINSINIDGIVSGISAMSEAEAEKIAAGIANAAAPLLAQCIQNAISSSGLSGGAIGAIGAVSAGGAENVGKFTYKVTASVDQQTRPSLDIDRYGGVTDMALLFDKGYSAGGRVFGEWNGRYIGSLVSRPATNFVERGVDEFKGSVPANCEVISTDLGRFG